LAPSGIPVAAPRQLVKSQAAELHFLLPSFPSVQKFMPILQAQLCSLRFLLFKNLFQYSCLHQSRSSKLPLQKFRRRLNRRSRRKQRLSRLKLRAERRRRILPALQTRLFRAQFFVPFVFFCSKTSPNPPVCAKLGRESFHFRSFEAVEQKVAKETKVFCGFELPVHLLGNSSKPRIRPLLFRYLRFLLFRNSCRSFCFKLSSRVTPAWVLHKMNRRA
jgi:hypothetical protein